MMSYYGRAIILCRLRIEWSESNSTLKSLMEVARALRAYARRDGNEKAIELAELHEAAAIG
jgi:hypothetical protein